MSYYYLKSAQIGLLEDDYMGIPVCVNANLVGRGHLKLDDWANGWIIENDEGFDLYAKLRWNCNVPLITDDEYKLLKNDRVVFFSKERTLGLRQGIRRPGMYDWNNKLQINNG